MLRSMSLTEFLDSESWNGVGRGIVRKPLPEAEFGRLLASFPATICWPIIDRGLQHVVKFT